MLQDQYSDEKPSKERALWKFRSESLAGGRGVLMGLGLGVIVTLVGTKLLSGSPSAPPSVQKASVAGQSVTIVPVRQTGVVQSLPIQGTVQARDWVLVIPKLAGVQIKTLLVDEGQQVEAGQVIATLDNTVQQEQVTQANAQAASASAQVETARTQRSAATAQVQSAQAQLVAADTGVEQKQAALNQEDATLKEAESNLRRYRSLAQSGAISKQELESRLTATLRQREAISVAKANIGNSVAAVGSAKAAVSQAQAGVKQADAGISRANADLANARARIKELQTQRERATVVTAPASGTIAKKTVQVGGLTSTQPMFEIIRNGALELQAKVPQVLLPKIRVGQTVQVRSDADSRIQLLGQVQEINPVVDETTRQALLKISLPPNPLTRPGMFLKGALNYGTDQALTVPTQAVLSQADGQKLVFVLKADGTVRSQRIEVGDPKQGQISVKQGLQVGDQVVVEGAGFLKDGDPVTVTR